MPTSEGADPTNTPLFIYLATQIAVPLPILVHATLQPDSSRNHILNSTTNRYVLHQLAGLIADVAALFAEQTNSWRGASIATPTASFDTSLEQLGFVENLERELKLRRVVPCIDGSCRKPSEACWTDLEIHDLVADQAAFGNLAKPNASRYLEHLGVRELGKEEICERIDKFAQRLSVAKRKDLILRLIEQKWLQEPLVPSLLIDANRKTIDAEEDAYIGNVDFRLPEWVPVRVVLFQLWELLKAGLECEDAELLKHLAAYSIKPFEPAHVFKMVSDAAATRIRSEADRSKVLKEAMHLQFKLFEKLDDPPQGPGCNIFLPDSSGDYCEASILYFGKSYAAGALTHELLKGVAGVKFITGSINLNLGESQESFLRWAGVATFPRMVTVNLRKARYDYLPMPGLDSQVTGQACLGVLERLLQKKEQLKFESPRIKQRPSAEWLTSKREIEIKSAQVPENLLEILRNATSEAILAWINLCPALVKLVRFDATARLSLESSGSWQPVTNDVPSLA